MPVSVSLSPEGCPFTVTLCLLSAMSRSTSISFVASVPGIERGVHSRCLVDDSACRRHEDGGVFAPDCFCGKFYRLFRCHSCAHAHGGEIPDYVVHRSIYLFLQLLCLLFGKVSFCLCELFHDGTIYRLCAQRFFRLVAQLGECRFHADCLVGLLPLHYIGRIFAGAKNRLSAVPR